MKMTARAILISVFLVILLTSGAFAQMGGFFPQYEWGAGYKGSSLFCLPRKDAFCLLYNPAFLVAANRQIALEQIRVYDIPTTSLAWSSQRIGGFLIVSQSPEGLGFNLNTYKAGLSLAHNRKDFSFGITPKLFLLSISEAQEFDELAWGYGIDGGICFTHDLEFFIFEDINISLAGEDIFSKIKYKSGSSEMVHAPQYRGGVALRGSGLSLGLGAKKQSDNIVPFGGLEYNVLGLIEDKDLIFEEINLRMGFQNISSLTFGVGIKMRGFQVDYGYTLGQENKKHMLSTNLYF